MFRFLCCVMFTCAVPPHSHVSLDTIGIHASLSACRTCIFPGTSARHRGNALAQNIRSIHNNLLASPHRAKLCVVLLNVEMRSQCQSHITAWHAVIIVLPYVVVVLLAFTIRHHFDVVVSPAALLRLGIHIYTINFHSGLRAYRIRCAYLWHCGDFRSVASIHERSHVRAILVLTHPLFLSLPRTYTICILYKQHSCQSSNAHSPDFANTKDSPRSVARSFSIMDGNNVCCRGNKDKRERKRKKTLACRMRDVRALWHKNEHRTSLGVIFA